MNSEGLFPARFLGFGLFWAWLFLAVLSPSPLFGRPLGFGDVPFEMCELLVRVIVLIGAIAFARRFSTERGKRVQLLAALVCGTTATVLLLVSEQTGIVFAASVLAAVAECSLFLLWMTFFGYMKLGETLALLVASYATGAVICLATLFAGQTAMSATSAVLPAASCAAFVLSTRYHAASEASVEQQKEPENLRAYAQNSSAHLSFTRPLAKMTIGLALYSFAFSLYLGIAVLGGNSFSKAYIVEPTSAVALAAIALLAFRFAQTTTPYALYRIVAPLFGVGFALLALHVQPLIAGLFVTLGYLTFEVLSYNDFCNIVKASDASLFKTIAFARLVNSLGMLVGWAAGFALSPHLQAADPSELLAVFALLVVLLTATLAFTDKDRVMMLSIADDCAVQESEESLPDRETAMATFAQRVSLSPRETEVLGYLLAGRTTSFAAEKLFVAESTVRAHVHNIYRKADVHSRMELLDEFERYRHEITSGQQE